MPIGPWTIRVLTMRSLPSGLASSGAGSVAMTLRTDVSPMPTTVGATCTVTSSDTDPEMNGTVQVTTWPALEQVAGVPSCWMKLS